MRIGTMQGLPGKVLSLNANDVLKKGIMSGHAQLVSRE